jgi:hypothetical protein
MSASKDFYINLLNSKNLYDRLDGWNKIDYLIDNGILTKKEIESLLGSFEFLLYNEDETVALHAFKLLDKLIHYRILEINERLRNKIVELVTKPQLDNWWVGEEMISKGILNPSDLSDKLDLFFNFLRLQNADQIDAWALARNLVKDNVIEKSLLKPYVKNILVLLKSDDMHLRFNSWLTASDLVKDGIANPEDFLEVREYLVQLLKSDYFDDLSKIYEKYASDFLDIMTKLGILNSSEN